MAGEILLLRRQCSRAEQRLLKALRAFGHEETPDEVLVAQQISMTEDDRNALLALIRAATHQHQGFELLGPKSPFVSHDELNLLATLHYFIRHRVDEGTAFSAALPPPLRQLFEESGQVLARTGIALRARPAPRLG